MKFQNNLEYPVYTLNNLIAEYPIWERVDTFAAFEHRFPEHLEEVCDSAYLPLPCEEFSISVV